MSPRQVQTVALIRRSIIDAPETVAARVALVRRSGRLVDMTTPELLPDGRASVVVVLRPPPPARPARRPARRRWKTAVVVAVSVAAAVFLAAVVLAAWWVSAHLAQIAAGLVVLLVLLFAATRLNHSGACPGLHCSGCRGGH